MRHVSMKVEDEEPLTRSKPGRKSGESSAGDQTGGNAGDATGDFTVACSSQGPKLRRQRAYSRSVAPTLGPFEQSMSEWILSKILRVPDL